MAIYLQTILAYLDGCTCSKTAFDSMRGNPFAKVPPLSIERLYLKEQSLVDLLTREQKASLRAFSTMPTRRPGTSLAAAIGAEKGAMLFQWHRALRLDASLGLPEGRSLGIIRIGHTTDRTGAAKRMSRAATRCTTAAVDVQGKGPRKLASRNVTFNLWRM